MIVSLPPDIQWIVEIILPILRESNVFVLKKILKNAVNFDSILLTRTRITATISTHINHSFWLAIAISTLASEVTGDAMLAVDFLINIFLTWKIIKLRGFNFNNI